MRLNVPECRFCSITAATPSMTIWTLFSVRFVRSVAVLAALLTFGSVMSAAPSADAQREETPFDESEVLVEAKENPDEVPFADAPDKEALTEREPSHVRVDRGLAKDPESFPEPATPEEKRPSWAPGVGSVDLVAGSKSRAAGVPIAIAVREDTFASEDVPGDESGKDSAGDGEAGEVPSPTTTVEAAVESVPDAARDAANEVSGEPTEVASEKPPPPTSTVPVPAVAEPTSRVVSADVEVVGPVLAGQVSRFGAAVLVGFKGKDSGRPVRPSSTFKVEFDYGDVGLAGGANLAERLQTVRYAGCVAVPAGKGRFEVSCATVTALPTVSNDIAGRVIVGLVDDKALAAVTGPRVSLGVFDAADVPADLERLSGAPAVGGVNNSFFQGGGSGSSMYGLGSSASGPSGDYSATQTGVIPSWDAGSFTGAAPCRTQLMCRPGRRGRHRRSDCRIHRRRLMG